MADASFISMGYVALDTASFDPRQGILTRYGRLLLEEGARFYARPTIAEILSMVPVPCRHSEGKVNWRKDGF
jgi:hypothetical protein